MATIRTWLKQEPIPTLLKVEYDDDSEKTVKLGESRSRFRDAESACRGALRIEALDVDGNTLRVWEAEDSQQRESAQVLNVTPGAADQMGMLTQIARLLVEASDAAATRHAEAYQLAYQQQALLVNVMSERLCQLEHAWQETLAQRAEELSQEPPENAPPPPNPNDQMVTTLLQGAMMKLASTGGGS